MKIISDLYTELKKHGRSSCKPTNVNDPHTHIYSWVFSHSGFIKLYTFAVTKHLTDLKQSSEPSEAMKIELKTDSDKIIVVTCIIPRKSICVQRVF